MPLKAASVSLMFQNMRSCREHPRLNQYKGDANLTFIYLFSKSDFRQSYEEFDKRARI